MGLLGLSIIFAFLIESDQGAVQFLDAIQLRFLFTVLVGAFTGTAVLCYDLADPFRGSFTVSRAVDQFYAMRAAMDQTFCAELAGEPPSGGALEPPATDAYDPRIV